MKSTMPQLRQQAEASEVLTLLEASKRLRVSERTLWALAKKNAVPHFKVGRQYRFLASALDAWARSQCSSGKDK